MPPARSLRVIHTPTPDWEQMRAFYRDVLLLPEAGGWDAPGDRGVLFHPGAAQIELMEQDAAELAIYPDAGGGGWRLALQVADIDQEYARLRALNIPIPRPVASRPWGARDFVIRDPAGGWILLFQTDET